MKINNFFLTLGLAALTFTACSEDEVNNNPDDGGKQQLGEIIESLSINFGEAKSTATRAYSGTQKGLGTEGMIYEAFIFAKEANPAHTRPMDGDWTVIRVTADPATGELITETGGVDSEKYAKDALTEPINGKSTADIEWLVKDVATFRGVRQGENVYVIANDPSLTLPQASDLAHKAANSEKTIQSYVTAINKEYLSGLTYRPEFDTTGGKELPTGKFIMAGKATIPVSPTIPSNGEFSITVGLDRELAKVNFSASVTTDASMEAAGKVAFTSDDGIIVARIARKVSPFTQQEADWYVPAINCVEDWPISSHALTDGEYNSFCDATEQGSYIFNGLATAATPWNGISIPQKFNMTTPVASVNEYRYSWKLDGSSNDTQLNPENYVYLSQLKDGKMLAPMFYVTPNYGNNTNIVTVICTQATYVARGEFEHPSMTDTYIDAALAEKADTISIPLGKGVAKITNPLRMKLEYNKDALMSNKFVADDITADVKTILEKVGIALLTQAEYDNEIANGALKGVTLTKFDSYEKYKEGMDRFYLATILNESLANPGPEIVGTQEFSPFEKQDSLKYWGNGILEPAKAYCVREDSLLLGTVTFSDGALNGTEYEKKGPVTKSRVFYLQANNDAYLNAKGSQYLRRMYTNDKFGERDENPDSPSAKIISTRTGAECRATYFANVKSYKYRKNQKLYYRADVSDYVGGISNKITERNTSYVSTGTIQTLGAKSIHDAIYSEQNTMHVDVKVNDWKLSINDIPM